MQQNTANTSQGTTGLDLIAAQHLFDAMAGTQKSTLVHGWVGRWVGGWVGGWVVDWVTGWVIGWVGGWMGGWVCT